MFKKMVILAAALVVLLGGETVYADTLIRSGVVSKAASPDSSDMTVLIKDNATGDSHEVVITDSLTKNKFQEGTLNVGDTVRVKFEDIGGRKVSKMFRKTDGSDSFITSVASTTTSANMYQSSNATCDANVPNPSPLLNETASFYGECRDGKPLNGIIIWKQNGVPFQLSCFLNGAFDDTVDIGIGIDKCSKYHSLVPNFCSKSDYRGQCLNDEPHGVGVKFWQESAGIGTKNYESLNGQFVGGKANGYIRSRNLKKCGYFGCSGHEMYNAWYEGGDEQYRCEGGPDGCRAKKTTESIYARAEQSVKSFRCEEALKLDRQAQSKDGQKHTESDYKNGYKISFSSCVEERTLNTHLRGKNPQGMYLAAGQYERKGESYNARKIYEAIVERFPSSSWAVKANDRLLGIKADSDASSRQSEFESNRRYEREKDAKECRNRKASCWSSCSDIKDYSARSSCQSRCNSICSE